MKTRKYLALLLAVVMAVSVLAGPIMNELTKIGGGRGL